MSIPKVSQTVYGHNYHGRMTKKTPPEWAARFEAMRKDKGVGLAVLAAKMAKTVPGVRHWLNGHRQITLQQFLDLCTAADIDPVATLFGPRYMEVARWEQIQGAAKTILEAKPVPYRQKNKRRARV